MLSCNPQSIRLSISTIFQTHRLACTITVTAVSRAAVNASPRPIMFGEHLASLSTTPSAAQTSARLHLFSHELLIRPFRTTRAAHFLVFDSEQAPQRIDVQL